MDAGQESREGETKVIDAGQVVTVPTRVCAARITTAIATILNYRTEFSQERRAEKARKPLTMLDCCRSHQNKIRRR